MWKPEKILFDESDDEGLSYVYFDFGDFRYFTLTLNPDEEEALKIEKHIDIDIVSHIDINSFGKTLANIFSNAGKP